jgi:hypothetical protein
MQITAKNQALLDLEKHFAAKVTDRLDMPIDSGILGTVVAFNACDIHTTGSCEGHLDWGAPYPWIDIGSRDARVNVIEQQIAVLLSEGKRGSQEIGLLYLELKRIHYQEEMKLMEALESFYRTQPLDYDRHLMLIHITRGGCRVRSQGADTQEFRSAEERASKLQEYQDEMHAFGNFLKRRFLGEAESEPEYMVGPAAALIGMKPETLTHNILRGNLAAEKRGRDYYIKQSELVRFKNTPRKSGRPKRTVHA